MTKQKCRADDDIRMVCESMGGLAMIQIGQDCDVSLVSMKANEIDSRIVAITTH